MRMLAVQAVVSTLAFGADAPRTWVDPEPGSGSLFRPEAIPSCGTCTFAAEVQKR
jgi:hypothetical protein